MIWNDLEKSGLMHSELGPTCSAILMRSASSKLQCRIFSNMQHLPDVQRTASDAQRQAKFPWKTGFLSPWIPNHGFCSLRVFFHNEMIKRTSFNLNMNDFKFLLISNPLF